jgi:thymidylate kinase
MKLILIDGGPASGKSSLGHMLVNAIKKQGEQIILLDLDSYVENYCLTWKWENEEQKVKDLLKAKTDFANAINQSLESSASVIAIGDRFMSKDEVSNYINKLRAKVSVQLFHLNVPFELRKQRLHARGPHSLINLEQDQQDREAVKEWPGYVYANVSSIEQDTKNLLKLIQEGQGLIQNGK